MTESKMPSDTASETSGLLYGAEAIGKFLGITHKQVRHRCANGQIPFFKIGGTICATESSLKEWLAARAREAIGAVQSDD